MTQGSAAFLSSQLSSFCHCVTAVATQRGGMGKLTESILRQWVQAGKAIAGRSDGDGLTFTLSAKGTAAWILRYRIAGQHKELTLGRYPELSLQQARAIAEEERVRTRLGIDVADEKQERRRLTAGADSLIALQRRAENASRALAVALADAEVARRRLALAEEELEACRVRNGEDHGNTY